MDSGGPISPNAYGSFAHCPMVRQERAILVPRMEQWVFSATYKPNTLNSRDQNNSRPSCAHFGRCPDGRNFPSFRKVLSVPLLSY
jgi:hypothetical protein